MNERAFSLEDKYRVTEGRIAITGVQALVRIPMDQRRRDVAAGLNTATYISGYQGSPLGEFDKQIQAARALLKEHHVVWQPGINEEIAATSVYGTQLLDSFPEPKYDGVLGMWYGKSPGVDRTMDAFKHGNFLGTSKYGGALALGGDDHACKSSTLPNSSDVAFYDANFPTLYPGNPQEVLEYGLHGFAMSRYSGLWVAIKVVTNVADGGGIIDVYPEMALSVIPELEINGWPFEKSQDIALIPPNSIETERQIHYERMLAATAYARINGLNRIVVQSGSDRIGLISAGKAYYDLVQALEMLGLGEEDLRQAGIRLFKMGMISPIETGTLVEFADGLEEIIVVEEKRGFMETLIRSALYNHPRRPSVYGKFDKHDRTLFPIHSELQVDQIARILAHYFAEKLGRVDLVERAKWLFDIDERKYEEVEGRTPYFCSGCPHNTSTNLPEGAIAGGGIGCHAMAIWMDRGIAYFTQMGGEGAPWMGLFPFTQKDHFFQNIGDGTYSHSGSKSLEACIASGVNMTFKILYNSSSAMTGGQAVVGQLSTTDLAHKLVREGVTEVVIVPEDMGRYSRKKIGEKIRVAPKSGYNKVMLEMQKVKGVSIIIFDQQCAAEKRRQRKRGILETPPQRVYINEAVCEGCGDCGVKSNCLSVMPFETGYGRKTRIHQSSCNMDYSCLKGDCPAFMTVELGHGTRIGTKEGFASPLGADLPEPATKADCKAPYTIMLVGIGGTGVLTVDALLVTAALIDGKYALHLDQTGLAQKGGPVLSNFIISDEPLNRANKIAAGETDTLLAFDFLAAVSQDNLNRYHPDRTRAVINSATSPTGNTVRNIHAQLPALEFMQKRIGAYLRPDGNTTVPVERIVDGLFGNSLSGNVFMVGLAYQSGLIPLAAQSIEAAIEANGVAVNQNIQAFRWGRKYQFDPRAVDSLSSGDSKSADPRAEALARLREFAPNRVSDFEKLAAKIPGAEALAQLLYPRLADLILYQNPQYAAKYLDYVLAVASEERRNTAGRTGLAEAVARWYFKLLAYKDEYEVARLWVQHAAWRDAKAAYEGPLKRYYQLHPPILRAMGMNRKIKLGEWFTPVLKGLASLKFLRGTALDPFGYAKARREERRLIGWYRDMVDSLLPALNHENHALAVEIASLPDHIRGYESVKERMIAETEEEAQRLQEAYRNPQQTRMAI